MVNTPVPVLNHAASVALHFLWYNFGRVHKTLRVTPAMEAGITDRVWDYLDVVKMMDDLTPKPGRRGPYKKRDDSNTPEKRDLIACRPP